MTEKIKALPFYTLSCRKTLLLLLFTAIEFSFVGSSPYTSKKKQIRINVHKLNNTKTQYKQYKTQ